MGGSKDSVATQQRQRGSRFSLSSCSTIFSRCRLMVTKELPWFQASYIHPRTLSAERKVKVREGEQKGSFLMCLFIQGGKFSSEVRSPCVGWNWVIWPLPSQSLAEEKDYRD